MTALVELPGQVLRELASLSDLRDQRRENNFQALLQGPPLSGSMPLGPLLPEQLASAMSCLALNDWSVKGLVRAADRYTAGRLPEEVVDRVVIDVLARRKRGEL
jgi:hypothetical protein